MTMAATLSRQLPKGIANLLQQLHTTNSTLALTSCTSKLIYRHSSSSPKQTPDKAVAAQSSVDKVGGKKNLPNEAIFYHPQHDMYVCWHPEVPFPYEMSKPIPIEATGTETNLKIQALQPVREVFRKKNERLIVREVMKLTYTPKYGWEGRHGRKIKYVKRDMDPLKQTRNRPYL
ncbi:uncharacterized protein LOC110855700 [Folsomia candida]|uniref:uncharacterized protein LOC110855700 n=1 Tax=Folsomia candida TaxID=158441 RepID=UPI000B8F916F|nr:uncharacterized protein LOC110855700 [Folsomia candida]